MPPSPFIRQAQSLLSLYEQNYILFRLVLPDPPREDGWFVLESTNRPAVYGHRLSRHPYTSEWLLGHFYPPRERPFRPDDIIRVYHDVRLAEALVQKQVSVKQARQHKLARNRALAEWLEYCHRHRYRLARQADMTALPPVEVLV